MKVLIQYPGFGEVPIGVWWEEDGEAKSYYAEPTRSEAKIGKALMLSRDASVPLDAVFEKLSARMPMTVDWSLVEIDDTQTPEEYLDMLRRVEFHARGVA